MPQQLKIGGFSYKVTYPYIFRNEPTFVGLHEGDQQTTKTSKYFANLERSWPKILESLFHEIVHAIDHCYCAKVMTEDETNVFSNALFMLFRENDLQLKKNKLPESIKIGTFVYDVQNPYDYDDGEDYSCSSDNEQLLFKMSMCDKQGKPYNGAVSMVNLLYLAMCSICETSCVPRGFSLGETLSNGGMHFITFCNGLYQVIVDNDLEKLMKSDGEMK